MRYIFIGLLFLTACKPDDPIAARPLTDLQKQYIESMTLAEKVYIENCLQPTSRYQYEFSYCQRHMIEDLNVTMRPKDNGHPIVNTAVGTALGYGAAKLILGK